MSPLLDDLRHGSADKPQSLMIYGAGPLGQKLARLLRAQGFVDVGFFQERIVGSRLTMLTEWSRLPIAAKTIVLIAIAEPEAIDKTLALERFFVQLGVQGVINFFELFPDDPEYGVPLAGFYAAAKRRSRFLSRFPHASVGAGADIGAVRVITPQAATLRIGAYTRIADGVTLTLDTAPDPNALTAVSLPASAAPAPGELDIGADVSIGAGALIAGNLTIGDGARVLPGAVVYDNVPPFAVVGGNPARVLRFRFDSDTQRELNALGWWNWSLAELIAARERLDGDDPRPLIEHAQKTHAQKQEARAAARTQASVIPRRDVCFAANDAMTDALCVTLYSLWDTHPATDFRVHVLADDLNAENRQRLHALVFGFSGWSLHIHLIDRARFADCPRDQGEPGLETWYRFLLPDLLLDAERALYLDCDLLIRQDLSPLLELELGEAYAAGVSDPATRTEAFKAHLESLGFAPDETCINAGVMMLNLAQIRADAMTEKLFDAIRLLQGRMQYPVQDALNWAFRGKLLAVDPRFNRSVAACWLNGDESPLANAAILHYTGPIKPWQPQCWWRGEHFEALKGWEQACFEMKRRLVRKTGIK